MLSAFVLNTVTKRWSSWLYGSWIYNYLYNQSVPITNYVV